MALNLMFYEGAKPGMKRKQTPGNADLRKKEKWQKYETKRPERKFIYSWKEGREWLHYDEEKQMMTCSFCISFYKSASELKSANSTNKFRGQNTFIDGSSNIRSSAVTEHENSKSHIKAAESINAASETPNEITQSKSGRALLSLKVAERHRIAHLFRNAHFIAKHNRPLNDYEKQCILDKAKGVDIGSTYMDEKAALSFIFYIAETETSKTVDMLKLAPFHSFLMDGSTDIAGDEQESLYARCSVKGVIYERFISLGSPTSTSSKDLFQFVEETYKENNIDIGKLVGMGSDGASNMTGHKSGLVALMRERIGEEFINIHCFCHRLELAVRDVFKKSKLYEKLMTLMIGLHYFYCKNQYKNKSGLLRTISAFKIDGLLPPKVTGTRWLPHIYRGIGSLLRTYTAYEAHLSTLSHTNPKAEGFVKLLLDKNVMAFVLFLQDVLELLMKLSLKLQKKNITLFDSITWVETTADLVGEIQTRENTKLNTLLETGMLQGVVLKGKTPSMTYTKDLVSNTCEALRSRFKLRDAERDIVLATKVLSLKNWPVSDSEKMQGYGDNEVKLVITKFQKTFMKANPDFDPDDAFMEWRTLKKILVKRHGTALRALSWAEVFDEDLPQIMLVVDLLLSLPPTSVSCETSFSQMKLTKTARRTNLQSTTLNKLLQVKLLSPDVKEFNPEPAIDRWLLGANKPHGHRRVNYKRQQQSTQEDKSGTKVPYILDDIDEDDITTQIEDVTDNTDPQFNDDIEILNSLCGEEDDDDGCIDFQTEDMNESLLLSFFRDC